MNRNLRLWALAIGAAIGACDGRSSTPDGAAPGPSDATSAGTCDPARQDCPTGQTCDLVCDNGVAKIMCRAVPAGGGVAAGAACSTTSGCGARTGCFATGTTPATCVRYCDTDADCGGQGTCQARMVHRPCALAPQFMLKFCLP